MTFQRAAFCLGLVAVLAASGGAAAQTPAALGPVPGRATPQIPDVSEPRGNPLWAVPLNSLSVTNERPIFRPSRRRPAPAVAAAPPPVIRPAPPPAEPDRPRLALVGTVASTTEGIAIFVEETTRDVVRLKMGEGRNGWILRSVSGREAVLQKDSETVMLALPAPSDRQAVAPPSVLPGLSPPIGAPGVLPGLASPSRRATPSGPPPRLPSAVPPPPTGRLPGL